jgi:CheY-like chemotaxis protein
MTVGAVPTRPAAAVLVADDDDAVRRSVSDILRLEGYVVSEVDDGSQAVTLLGREQFDVLVLNDRMPALDGQAVLAAVEDPPPTVIMSTGEADPGHRKDLAVRGIAYLHKPIDAEHLLDAVATAMGRGRQPP